MTTNVPGSSNVIVVSSIPAGQTRQLAASAAGIVESGNKSVSAPLRYVNSLASNIRPSDMVMVFLDFQINAGQVTLRRQWKVPGNMRLPPLVVPEKGVFHRMVTAEGEVLAQGIISDPALIFYDYIDPDSGRPKGRTVIQSDASFNVRYPWIEGADSIELYQVEASTDLSTLTPTSSNYHGSFKI